MESKEGKGMSSEVFKAMQKMNLKEIEMQLALQCAPLFSGLKVSNLLIIQRNSLKQLDAILSNTHISYYVLLRRNSKITILLYDEKRLFLVLATQVKKKKAI